MRSLFLIASVLMLIFVLATHPSDAGDAKKKTIKPTLQWSGKSGNDALAKLVPKVGYITVQKEFDALWAGWMLKDKAPLLDFDKQIVFIQLATGGPNVPRPTYSLDANGNLTVVSISTLIGGPGFGYSIDVLHRNGVKTYQGKAIVESKQK